MNVKTELHVKTLLEMRKEFINNLKSQQLYKPKENSLMKVVDDIDELIILMENEDEII